MESLFWLSAVLLLYPYAGYPLFLWVWGLWRSKTVVREESGEWPTVTLLIAAYNEEEGMAEKLQNSLELDYPVEKREIMVASESTDGTNAIVEAYRDQEVKLYAFSQRRGKPALLYSTVPLARGEIVVFSDANAFYEPSALKKLVRNFADGRLGCVSGQLRFAESGTGAASRSENLYWKYEMGVKRLESRVFSLLGANGSIFALRKSLYAPLSEVRGDDFELPVRVLLQGYGAVLEPEARSWEKSSASVGAEFRRRVRIVSWFLASTGLLLKESWRARKLALIVQLVSHRLLRWAVPLFLLLLLASSAAAPGRFYAVAVWLQVIFYAAAAIGWGLDSKGVSLPALLRLPYYFCAIHVAVLVGLKRGLSAPAVGAWEKVR